MKSIIPQRSSAKALRGNSISSSSAISTFDQSHGFLFKETLFASNEVISITTTAQFFNDTSMAMEKNREIRSKHSSYKLRRSRSSNCSLDSIDEDKEIDVDDFMKDKKVKVTSLVIPHDGNGCSRFIANNLHQAITEHPQFTSLANMPEVFRDVFISLDDAFMKSCEENDESGCSVVCAVITSTHGICVAHVGEARGIIRGTDGVVAELTVPHLISLSNKEKVRLQKANGYVSSDNKLFGKLTYSRSFGHKSLKQLYPGCLIALPNVIQIKMNLQMEAQASFNGNSTTTELLAECSSRSNQSATTHTVRFDILLILGSYSAWENYTDKKMCATITSSLLKGESINEAVEKVLNTKRPTSLLFWKDRTIVNPQIVPKGLYVVNWVSYSS